MDPKTSNKNYRALYKDFLSLNAPSIKKDLEAFSFSFYGEQTPTPSSNIYNLQQEHPIIYRVLESYSSDCLRKWITFKGDAKKIEYIEKRFIDLNVKDKIRQALNSALKDGESLIYLGFDSDNLNMMQKNEPLEKKDIKKIDYISVISRRFYYRLPRFTVDPTSKKFNEQDFIIYQANKDKIHKDRLLWLCNFYDPDTNLGISYFNLLHEASYALNQLLKGVSKSSSRLSSYFLFSDELLNAMLEEQSNMLLTDMKHQLDQDSIIALESNAKMETSQLVATGFDLLKDFVFEVFTAISGVPQNILLGRAQGVMASAQQDSLNYYAKVNQIQENIIRPILTPLIDYILSEKGFTEDPHDGDLEDVEFYFNSLIEESEIDRLTRQNVELDMLLKLSGSGIIEDKDVIEFSSFTQDKAIEYNNAASSDTELEDLLKNYNYEAN